MAVQLSIGIQNGKTIHISELGAEFRGNKCNCICPSCHGALIARLGQGKRTPHFSHLNRECNILHAQQTGLHLIAKDIIAQNRRILLPGWSISRSELFPDKYEYQVCAQVNIDLPSIESKEYEYDSVQIEKSYGDIVADAVVTFNGHPCIVEIAVTHFVDELKAKKAAEHEYPMFEIDLSSLLAQQHSREEITASVLNSSGNRRWIYNPRREAILSEKRVEFLSQYSMIIKSREEQQRNKKENILSLKQLFAPEKYAEAVKNLQNDKKADYWLKRFDFSSRTAVYPFYMNIPITGEFVFSCDRRIWQGKLFEDYVFRGFGKELCCFEISRISDRIFKNNMIIHFDKRKTYPTSITLESQEKKIFLPYDVIKQYFLYLELIGFVSHVGFEWYSRRPISLEPPNQSSAIALSEVIQSVDQFCPNIDLIIKRGLMSRLSKNENCGILTG